MRHHFSRCVKMRLFLDCICESALAGSAVPQINQILLQIHAGAAGPIVSAESLSQCVTAPVTIVIFS